MNHFISNEATSKAFKVIALYGATLTFHPILFFIIRVLMSPSFAGPGKGASPEEPFLLSSAILCLINILFYRNMFGRGKVIKSILLSMLVIALCMILGKLDVGMFRAYYSS